MTSGLVLAAADTPSLLHGTLAVAAPVAFLAGLVSFLSPCVLPLVPGYLSYVTSLSVSDLAEARGGRRSRMAAGALLFVLGFTAVLVSGGALFGYFGRTLLAHQEVITRVLGVFTVLMGLSFMGFLPGFTQREFRSHRRPALGLAGAPCSARCSRSAGRPASARRWPPYRRWPGARPARAEGRC